MQILNNFRQEYALQYYSIYTITIFKINKKQ